MPRMPKKSVAPCLNTFRLKDSNSTYARTKVPAYLKAAAPDLKQTVNWGKLTPETKPEVEAKDAFEKGQVAIRAYMRFGVSIPRPTAFCKLTSVQG